MVTEKEVENIAKLAKLNVSTDEKSKLFSCLNDVLEYFKLLDEIKFNAEGIKNYPGEQKNSLATDIVAPSLTQNEALKNAAKKQMGLFYRVKE